MVGVAVAMVTSTIHEKPCMLCAMQDSCKRIQNSVIHIFHNQHDGLSLDLFQLCNATTQQGVFLATDHTSYIKSSLI